MLHIHILCSKLYYTLYLEVAFTLAPWSNNSLTMSANPPEAASIKGVESPTQITYEHHTVTHLHRNCINNTSTIHKRD